MHQMTVNWHGTLAQDKSQVVEFISGSVSRILFFRTQTAQKFIDVCCALPTQTVGSRGYNMSQTAPLSIEFRYFFDKRSLFISLRSDEPVAKDIYESMEQEWLILISSLCHIIKRNAIND